MRYEDLQDGFVPYLLGAVLIFVLLLILHQVLRDAVQQGASLNISYAERVETNWRCSAAHGPRERDNCVAMRTSATSKDVSQLLATAEMRKP